MAGGGVHGKVVGIALSIITRAGVIIMIFQVSILMWIRVGEDITGVIIGMDTAGTINGFLTDNFIRTGSVGKMVSIGKGRERGAL